MSRGRQDAGPEWRAICREVRRELLRVCPIGNRRFTREPGTFSRQWVTWKSGVSLANIRRMVDEQLPSSPDTIERLAKFLGLRLRLERVAPLPRPSEDIDEFVIDARTRRRRRRRSTGVQPSGRDRRFTRTRG